MTRRASSFPRPVRRDSAFRGGFTLVLVLALLALLMILVVSLSAVLNVETQAAATSKDLLEARQNALLGLDVAIGQLQKYAGRDQAVTFPATTYYPSKDVTQGTGELYDDTTFGYRGKAATSSARSYLAKVGTYLTPDERASWEQALDDWWNNAGSPRNPHWTGIMDASLRVDRATNPSGAPTALAAQRYEVDPNTLFGEPKRDQLPVWLVSGNEAFAIDPANDTAYPPGYATPDTPLDEPDLTDPDSSTIWLVGEGSAMKETDSADGLDGRVKAPKVEIKKPDNTLVGHYAYWVGDESTKANFAVRDPYFEAASGTSEYRNRLQSPQRVGWENLSGFFDLFDSGATAVSPNDEKLDLITTTPEITLLDDQFQSPDNLVAKNFHHLTAHSQSLLTDTALGGLKKDLTRYLEDGSGLADAATIPDRTRYTVDDPRFAAWGGTNAGFPNAGAAALDSIPTWGQLRDWYRNEATGGGITPDGNTGPVLTYLMLHAGLSYDPATKRIRWHWLPCVVLWNPYDVALNNATYNLEVGVSPKLAEFYVAKENPTLAELQMDADANWTDDPDPVTDADGDGDPSNDWQFTDSTGTVQTIIRQAPDKVDMKTGPWPRDSNLADGTTDAFGRFYYRLNPVKPQTEMWHQRVASDGANGEKGPLGDKEAALKLMLHDPQKSASQPEEALPVNSPLDFQITTNFAPGEAKVFTVGSATQWTAGTPVALTNDFSTNQPSSLWFDILEVANGPASATAEDIKWFFELGGESITAPTVELAVGGDTIQKAERGFGAVSFGDVNAVIPESGQWMDTNGDGKTKDDDNADGDGSPNTDESFPKFVHKWRSLYDFANFDDPDKMLAANPSLAESSIFGFGQAWIAPLTGRGDESAASLHEYLPVFSRFNLGGKSFDLHPLIEYVRNEGGPNNYDYQGRNEGLTRLAYIRSSGSKNLGWTDDQAAGGTGFALVTYQQTDDAPYLGLDSLPVRNARRAGSEILSLGQFQQANLSPHFWQPSFPIGNSDAAPYTDREAIAGIHSRLVGTQTKPASGPDERKNSDTNYGDPRKFPNNAARVDTYEKFSGNFVEDVNVPGNTLVDLSYLLNENLWDRYFLSTIADGTPDLEAPLPNSRLRFAESAASAGGELTDFDTAAAHLRNFGALNVNSTSVEAWKALLTAFRDLELRSQSNSKNPDETVPVSRSLDPIGDAIAFTEAVQDADAIGATGTNKDYSQLVSGFRYLTDAMIQTLAERIVDEVRLRGPFLSLADFVNRRLVAPQGSNQQGSAWYEARTNGRVGTESYVNARGGADRHPDFVDPSYDPFIGLQGLNGVLQRAINVSGINGGVNHPALGDNGLGVGDGDDRAMTVRIKDDGDADYQGTGHFSSSGIGGASNTEDHHSQEPAMRSHLDSEHLAGAPAGEAGQLFAGAPGFVTQGDLLAMIGPALTPRGDTFLVRSYGDKVAPNGRVLARAWLEAVVQRVPEPVTPAAGDAWRYTDQFGRRFEVVGFRWLTPEDV